MDRKRVSDPERAELGKFQGDIDRNANFRDSAFNHNLGRNVRVIKVLIYLARMIRDGCRLRGPVDCVAAKLQNFSSSSTRTQMGLPAPPSQAAHFLPGQLQVGGRDVWEFASDYSTRCDLEFLFAEVEHLPLAFNQADSAAESKDEPWGLGAAFAAAGAELIKQSNSGSVSGRVPGNLRGMPHPYSPDAEMFNWTSAGVPHPDAPAARTSDFWSFGTPHPDSPSGLSMDAGHRFPGPRDDASAAALVHAGFAVWHSGAITALEQAARAKGEKAGLPPLEGDRFEGYTPESIERRSNAESKLWNRDEALRILGYYLQDQQQRTPEWADGMCTRYLHEL